VPTYVIAVLSFLGGMLVLGLLVLAYGIGSFLRRTVNSMNRLIESVNPLLNDPRVSNTVYAIQTVATMAAPIAEQLKMLNQTMLQLYQTALSREAMAGEVGPVEPMTFKRPEPNAGAAPEDTSSFFPYDERVARAMDERDQARRSGVAISHEEEQALDQAMEAGVGE
jgi:hypothetical protein